MCKCCLMLVASQQLMDIGWYWITTDFRQLQQFQRTWPRNAHDTVSKIQLVNSHDLYHSNRLSDVLKSVEFSIQMGGWFIICYHISPYPICICILYYIILNYTILYYIILNYIILYIYIYTWRVGETYNFQSLVIFSPEPKNCLLPLSLVSTRFLPNHPITLPIPKHPWLMPLAIAAAPLMVRCQA